MRRFISSLLVYAIGCPACFAGNGSDQKHVENIRNPVAIYLEKGPMVSVETYDQRKMSGAIVEAGPDTFVLTMAGTPTSIPLGQGSQTPGTPTTTDQDSSAYSRTASSSQNWHALAPPPAEEVNADAHAKEDSNAWVIPAGSKIALTLSQAISTKNAREGDAVYAVTAYPFAVGNRILVPAGTYIQGKVSRVQRAGIVKGRAEILMHFTSMIYPSGYTVMLPGSVENMPGSDNTTVKDKEGTVQRDKTTRKRVEDAAKAGQHGAIVGGAVGGLAAGNLNGLRVGGVAGAVVGIAWVLLKRGPDVKLDAGTSIEMQVERPITIDAGRVQMAPVVR